MGYGVFRLPPPRPPSPAWIGTLQTAPPAGASLAALQKGNPPRREETWRTAAPSWIGTSATAPASLLPGRLLSEFRRKPYVRVPAPAFIGTFVVPPASLLPARLLEAFLRTRKERAEARRQAFIGTNPPAPTFSFSPFERQRLLLELFRRPFIMPPKAPWIGGTLSVAAFVMQPDSCTFLFRINRPEISAKAIDGDPVSPEYQVQGYRIVWLSNRPQITTKKASS